MLRFQGQREDQEGVPRSTAATKRNEPSCCGSVATATNRFFFQMGKHGGGGLLLFLKQKNKYFSVNI